MEPGRPLPLPPSLAERLPPDDRSRSPFTGFTRAHWEAVADLLLAAVRRHASPRGALVAVPGGRPSAHGARSDGLEGFARSFLIAAFRLAGAGGAPPGDLATRYAEGLAAGTEPGHEESWPAIEPLSQPMVEAAAIAIALFETRPWIWDALAPAVQERVVAWLSGSVGRRHWPDNWLLFQVIVNAFLASVGAPHRADEVARNLDLVESMARRDGWYSDGPGASFDHYGGWALHLDTLWWIRMGGEAADPARAARLRARTRRFLADHAHLFAADGAPLHQGRSLIYRFAAGAPLLAGALLDATPLAPGETRRIASGTLRHFLARGALRDDLLTMGWYREHLPMAQAYSGPASPYWAGRLFLGLLLPAEHPVWQAREQPMPVERGDFVRALPAPGWLVRGTRRDGIVRIANHGSHHVPAFGDDPHYRKLGYATHAAPELPPRAPAAGAGADADAAGGCDAELVLVGADGRVARRGRIHPIAAEDRFAASCWYPGEAAVVDGRAFPIWLERVETVSIALGAAELRVHHVATFGVRRVREGGFALADDERPPEVLREGAASIVRRRDGLVSAVVGLHGLVPVDAERRTGANAFGHHSAAPVVESPAPVGAEGVFVSLHVLGAGPFDLADARERVAAVRVDGRIVRIACRDGERFLVQLVAPDDLDERLGDLPLRGPVRFARVSPDGSSFVLRGHPTP